MGRVWTRRVVRPAGDVDIDALEMRHELRVQLLEHGPNSREFEITDERNLRQRPEDGCELRGRPPVPALGVRRLGEGEVWWLKET